MHGEGIAQQCVGTCAPTLRQQAIADTAVVLQREGHLGMRQRNAPERLFAMPVLGAVGAQEFAPRGGVEIELLYRHRRSARQRRWLRDAYLAAVDLDAPSVWLTT